MTNIFGLTKTISTVAGIPLIKMNSLTPHERIWLQENTEAGQNEFNITYYEFIKLIQKEAKLKDDVEAYEKIKAYYDGTSQDSRVDAIIELASIKDPSKAPKRKDLGTEQTTFLLNARILKEKFPKDEFLETFGIKYDDTWTIEHTKAIAQILPQINEFFEAEMYSNHPESEVTGEEKKG
jgi:hypothetical protein